MESLKDKKLLVVGANPETIPLVQIANELGVKTIVTSNKETDPAKKYAWKSFEVDGLDVPGLIALANQEKVDGILVGVADILVPVYCKVCAALNLPCYATPEIVNVFSYKDVFKATCERYGVHGIPEYYLDETLNPDDISKIVFPVMVKPVDGYSGLGMTVCYDASQLKDAVEKALSFSKCKRFIVERYMQCDDLGIYYTFKDGCCSASCIFDRFTTDKQPGLSRVCIGAVYPSKHIKDYFSRMHPNAVNLFKEIGIKNGVLLFQAFYENGEFYVYDTGFRLQGEAPHLHMKAIHGFDQREMLVRYALTGSEGDIDLAKEDNAYFRGKWASTLWILLKEGKIKDIQGLEHIDSDPRVVAYVQRLYVNDNVPSDWIGTEKQVMIRIYFVCETKQQLADCVKEYQRNIQVLDTQDNDMVLNGFDIDAVLN